jgi:hypothetical protein
MAVKTYKLITIDIASISIVAHVDHISNFVFALILRVLLLTRIHHGSGDRSKRCNPKGIKEKLGDSNISRFCFFYGMVG